MLIVFLVFVFWIILIVVLVIKIRRIIKGLINVVIYEFLGLVEFLKMVRMNEIIVDLRRISISWFWNWVRINLKRLLGVDFGKVNN